MRKENSLSSRSIEYGQVQCPMPTHAERFSSLLTDSKDRVASNAIIVATLSKSPNSTNIVAVAMLPLPALTVPLLSKAPTTSPIRHVFPRLKSIKSPCSEAKRYVGSMMCAT